MKFKVTAATFIKSATAPEHYPDLEMNEVAFAGRSNVGKSSLINTLVNRKDLVRISKRPGATQLINFFTVKTGGGKGASADTFPMGLVDLPGYGFAKVPDRVRLTWGKMIDAYLTGRPTLKAVVVVMDIRRGVRDEDMQLIDALRHFQIAPVLVFTKADKLSRNKQFNARRAIAKELGWSHKDLLLFSSLSGQGIDDLWEVLRLLTAPDADIATLTSEEESTLWPDASAYTVAGAAPDEATPDVKASPRAEAAPEPETVPERDAAPGDTKDAEPGDTEADGGPA